MKCPNCGVHLTAALEHHGVGVVMYVGGGARKVTWTRADESTWQGEFRGQRYTVVRRKNGRWHDGDGEHDSMFDAVGVATKRLRAMAEYCESFEREAQGVISKGEG